MADRTPRLGKAVEDGELRYVSPSQVTTASHDQDGGCLRKWWFDKVAGIKPPSTKSQELGTAVHAELEHYLNTGEAVLGKIAAQARPHLPPPKSVLTEHSFGIDWRPGAEADALRDDVVLAGVPVIGFVDVLNLDGLQRDASTDTWTPSDVPEVIDWKTSGNPTQYAKTGTALVRTVQMPIYGAIALRRAEEAGRRPASARVTHVTLATKGKPEPVRGTVVLDRLTIERRLFTIGATVDRMKAAAVVATASDVDFNAESCKSFGGCPYWDTCEKPAIVALRTALGGKGDALMSTLDDLLDSTPAKPAAKPHRGLTPGVDARPADLTLAEKKAWLAAQQEREMAELEAEEVKASTPPPAAKPAPAVAPGAIEFVTVGSTKPAPAKRATIKAKDAKQRSRYILPFGGAMVPVEYISLTRGGRSFGRLDGGDGPLILADDEELYVGDDVVAPDAPKSGESGPAFDPIPAGDTVPEKIRAAQGATPAPPPVEEKPKRTRKAKAPAEPPAPPPQAPAQALGPAASVLDDLLNTDPAPTETAARALESTLPVREPEADPEERVGLTPEGAKHAPPPVGYTLLLNAALVKGGGTTSLADLMEFAHEAIRLEFKCVDLRTATDERLTFGRWKGVFAAAIRHAVEKQGVGGYVVADLSSELASVAVEALMPGAVAVIRGF